MIHIVFLFPFNSGPSLIPTITAKIKRSAELPIGLINLSTELQPLNALIIEFWNSQKAILSF